VQPPQQQQYGQPPQQPQQQPQQAGAQGALTFYVPPQQQQQQMQTGYQPPQMATQQPLGGSSVAALSTVPSSDPPSLQRYIPEARKFHVDVRTTLNSMGTKIETIYRRMDASMYGGGSDRSLSGSVLCSSINRIVEENERLKDEVHARGQQLDTSRANISKLHGDIEHLIEANHTKVRVVARTLAHSHFVWVVLLFSSGSSMCLADQVFSSFSLCVCVYVCLFVCLMFVCLLFVFCIYLCFLFFFLFFFFFFCSFEDGGTKQPVDRQLGSDASGGGHGAIGEGAS
jgi:hypothetical protein